ncbi:hypothetical protein K492DRAFT_189235 [Lichtheimia hyalospora FSU 10163]|nr:hypothetical protein K492DRAFT_189235 [Lichtheimia hyalospora FSU 10163]
MTCDTGESTDAYKISISSENPLDDHVKQRFEKGLSALLADPYFLLLHVPENGAKMHIVQPAEDPYHRERMVKRINEAKGIPSFYYALSHLWKISKDDPQLWEDIGEYVNDLDEQPAKPVSIRPEKRDTLLGLLKDHPDSYWWIDVLCARTDTPLDIMGDIYRCCLECIAMIDCEPSVLSGLHTEPNKRKEYIDFDWTDAMVEPSSEDLLYCKQIYEKYPELLYRLAKLQQSEWWNRVWTWQEMALPFGNVRLTAETGTQGLQSDTITVDDLINNFKNAWDLMLYVDITDDVDYEDIDGYRDLCPSWICCTNPVDYVYGVLGMLNMKIPRMTDPEAVWQRFLSELDSCMDMEDIKSEVIYLPGSFSGKIVGIKESAYEIDLQKVEFIAADGERIVARFAYWLLYSLVVREAEREG